MLGNGLTTRASGTRIICWMRGLAASRHASGARPCGRLWGSWRKPERGRGKDMDSQDHLALGAVTWEVTDCPLCGAFDDEELLLKASPCGGATYRLARCRRCGLGYLNPRPGPPSLGLFYPDAY